MKKFLFKKECVVMFIIFGIMSMSIALADTTGTRPTTTGTSPTASETLPEMEELRPGNGVYGTLYNLMGILAGLGIALCIGKLMHIGIKFITQPAGGRSNAKESLLPWFIGLLVLANYWTLAPWLINAIAPSDTQQTGIFDI